VTPPAGELPDFRSPDTLRPSDGQSSDHTEPGGARLRRRHGHRLWRCTEVTLGVAIKLTAFHLRNARNDVDAATQEGLRGLLGNGATSYYAKDVGVVLSEASGSAGTTTVRLRGCAGS
jgi:hypothetical protein